jgi:outer membrane putative beta-barrel porin/alpha-amylase
VLERAQETSAGMLCILVCSAIIAGSAAAQELEPRAYSPSPVGTTFLIASFGRSHGGVTFDPSVPLTGVHANLYSSAVGMGQTFSALGRQALITIALPYAWGDISGQVGERSGGISRSGLADLKLRFSMNLHGSPARAPREFAISYRRTPILGISLSVDAPSGQYAKSKLVNLGTNRWAFKPELGLSYPARKFDIDFYAGAWFFTDNSHFFPGTFDRSQEVLTSTQAHISYTFRPGLWFAVDSTWYGGGAVRVNQGSPASRQSSTRLGATLSVPLVSHNSLKIAYSSGVTARTGSNFAAISISWQHVWFDHR